MRRDLRTALILTVFAACSLLSSAPPAAAQCVSLTTPGSPSTQNFNTLASTGTANTWTDNSTIAGGYASLATYRASTGTDTTGALYSYGTAAADRTLGSQGSNATGTIFYALCFQNNTGAPLTSLDIAYTGEQWRNGGNTTQHQLLFEYQVAATGTITDANVPATGWTSLATLNFTGPIATATAAALDGNNAANRVALSANLPVAVPVGQEIWLRWQDPNDTGNDHGLGIDDVSVTPNGGVAQPNLSINDVSLNEGNAGTTNFTFTVSLSAPAGPGGVTFDIATADGTAQDDNPATEDNDYVPQSLTGQTIPAGSSTYAFTVLVNGDTAPETNETFFVNVTNVTGAMVTDGQGQGTIVNDDAAPNLTINDVSLNEGNAGTTSFTFTVSLSAPAGPGGVTFDIATADGTAQDDNPVTEDNDYVPQSLTAQTIPAGSSTYAFTVLVNGDTTPETDETFLVNVTNVTNAIATDSQGLGTIVNDDITRIHDVQGSGAATPIPGATVTVEGVVIGDYQATGSQLQGFFLQEEDADADADPATSEGIFVFCITCPTAVAEGQRVRVTGTVSEFFNMTEITASTAPSVVVTDAGNHLAEVTPAPIDLPVVGDIDSFYEPREGMRVTFVDPLAVSEYFELFRYGQIELYEGGRPRQFTEMALPSVAGNAAHLDNLNRRRVILDDENNTQNWPLTLTDGMQFDFHPRANGGFSVGTQGTDFFRGGDLVNGLTGVLHWSFSGLTGTDAWRIRPTAATPATFTVANPRPAMPPTVGGAIKAVGMNLLNYFTTIDTTSSNNSGPCGPAMDQDCRGADSVAELIRQRERASIVICTLNADVYGFGELENTTASATITDLLGAVNTRCGGVHPYAFVNTGGTLGTDAIRVELIYRTGVLSPVGAALVDLDSIHNRPPTAQTFDVVDAANPAFGQRFTVIANHFKSKGCDASAVGADADAGDGQGCYNGRRTAQASRLLTWIGSTVVPAAGDPDVLLLGDFNSYAQEDPVTTLEAGGYTDTEVAFLGANAYSYLFDGQLGHLDYAFASASLFAQVTGADAWHINADEVPLLDYSDEIRDTGEAAFEEKPDGSALVPPRVVYQPNSPYRASDHDPVLLGIFQVADVSVTKTDSPDPVIAGSNLIYTITVTNAGPDPAGTVALSDTLPAGTTFVSLPTPAGWSCSTGATISCSIASLPVGSTVFTLTVNVGAGVASGTVLSNTATVTSATSDPTPGNNSATATTTVATSADVAVTKTDSPDPVTAGSNLTYTITVTNNGPSNAATVALSDTLPAGTTFVSLPTPAGWSCSTGATISCSIASLPAGSTVFTLTVNVGAGVASGTVLSNTATVSTATTDPVPANNSATATTTVATSADVSVTKTDAPDPVTAGSGIIYTITVTNSGPSDAASVNLSDSLPAGTTFDSMLTPAGWSCTTGATISCSIASLPAGSAVFTLTVNVGAGVASGTVLSNTATVSSTTSDPAPGNNSSTAVTTVGVGSADLRVTKVGSPDPVIAGNNLVWSITVENNGPSDAANVSFTDLLTPGTTFVTFGPPSGGWSCTTPAVGANGTISCSIPVLPALDGTLITVLVHVDPAVVTDLTNTATITTTTADPRPGNESATAVVKVTTSADLSITKVDTPDPVAAGANLTYTITVANAGLSNAAAAMLSDTLPAGTTFVSLASPAGWSCATPAVGAGGTVSCTNPSAPVGSAVFTLTVAVGAGVADGTVLSNTATVSSTTTDPAPGNNSATATTTVNVDTVLTATKTAAGTFAPGSTVTYTVVVSNPTGQAQTDNPGAELTDVLPAELTLVSATATSGTATATVATNTVTWNGAVAANSSVTLTIQATVNAGVPAGTPVQNQATLSYDANGDGTNESTAVSDDPATGGAGDPTVFAVGGQSVIEVPTLDTVGLALLALLLALGGATLLRRRRTLR